MQAKIAEINAQAQADAGILQLEYQLKSQLEALKSQTSAGMKQADMDFRREIEEGRERAKDSRVKKQAVEQSKMISQRQGKRGELEEDQTENILSRLLSGNQ